MPAKTILGTDIQRGQLLHNPANEPGNTYKGKVYYPHRTAMKITKYMIVLDNYKSIPKCDENGKPLEYILSD